jgi:hypothetical protein
MNSRPPNITYPSNIVKTPGLATASLVCGIASFFLLCLAGIPAVICGHKALSKINKSQGQLGGSGLAIAGLVLGYISIALTLIIVPLAAIATPVIMKTQKKANMITASTNAKQVFMLMVDFDQEYEAFPGDETAIDELAGYTGKSSNDYLAQFFIAGYTNSEEMFYVKGGSSTDKKPDNIINTCSSILSSGECGFAYIKNQSTSHNSGRPLLLAPMTGNGLKFDPEPFGGYAIVLRIDGAVKRYRIDENGDLVMPDRRKFWAGGVDTVWGAEGFNEEDLVFPK